MKHRVLVLVFNALIFLSACSPGKNLVWADEFNIDGLPDTTRWAYDVGDDGWGNNEKQFYTLGRPENARVENGKLIIEARRERFENAGFTSARLLSKKRGDWKYGRIEVRAKLPQGRGIWPAIWMLPTDWKYGGWPKSGEIDIMEFVGYVPDTVYGSVHTAAFNHAIGTNVTGSTRRNDLSQAFHVYAIEWTPDNISFFIDDEQYHSFKNNGGGSEAWPFDQPFHLLMNVAVGGNWGGKFGVDESIFPQRMEVDYVRVYQ